MGVTRKPLPGTPKLYDLQENNSACVFCSLLCRFYFVDDKSAVDLFKI